MFTRMIFFTVALLFIAGGCVQKKPLTEVIEDPHSYSNFNDVVVEHLHLNLELDFDDRVMRGSANLKIKNKNNADKLVLDTRDLKISKITLDEDSTAVEYVMGPAHPLEGSALSIPITDTTQVVHIHYATSPAAEAVQWLSPEQTSGGKKPFVFTQNQPILARTWIPCQDSPSVRMTYSARITTDEDVLVLMSARNPIERSNDGSYVFTMGQPVPSYLIALAAGDLQFRELGPRSGVYAEEKFLEKAVYDFGDTEKMMEVTEAMYGPYRWERYDILVLPPSFPFGGMENPRLTFATPTILSGDRSLNALVAHELAHSWSGNLVTNATWEDIWLNEGFTSYIENRIIEALYGKEYAKMMQVLDHQKLQAALDRLGRDSSATKLHVDLEGEDPDEGLSAVAYDKGHFFLATLENYFGRKKWDAFLQKYFETFAFKPMTSARFIDYIRAELLEGDIEARQDVQLHQWIYGTGMPDNYVPPTSEEFNRVDAQREVFLNGADASTLETNGWTTHHWRYFLNNLPKDLSNERLANLDDAFNLTKHNNYEILYAWLHLSVPRNYGPSLQAAEEFLLTVGRIKFVAPLYGSVISSEIGKDGAKTIYEQARDGYHPLTRRVVESILN